MATNLVSLIMQFLTPDMIGRIATALGLDRNIAQTAIGAVVPALLAGFSKTATQPGGAQKLVDAARQQTGTLGNFANMLGTGGQSSLIEKGSQMLSALLGGQDQNALAQAVAKFAGLGQGPAGSLLGMLAPVVMGTIGTATGPVPRCKRRCQPPREPKGQYCRGTAHGLQQLAWWDGLARRAWRCGAVSDEPRAAKRHGLRPLRPEQLAILVGVPRARRPSAQLALLAHPDCRDCCLAHLLFGQTRGASGPAGRDLPRRA